MKPGSPPLPRCASLRGHPTCKTCAALGMARGRAPRGPSQLLRRVGEKAWTTGADPGVGQIELSNGFLHWQLAKTCFGTCVYAIRRPALRAQAGRRPPAAPPRRRSSPEWRDIQRGAGAGQAARRGMRTARAGAGSQQSGDGRRGHGGGAGELCSWVEPPMLWMWQPGEQSSPTWGDAETRGAVGGRLHMICTQDKENTGRSQPHQGVRARTCGERSDHRFRRNGIAKQSEQPSISTCGASR